ncbi:hypothetical protein [uncultured Ruminococcus sp.]|uniref:hypothetical protein n=1 Tax=uncultured Ruminococcus sp. TaxID=165186 RepID=UPI0025E57D33|nr:hypothetical protein [uncultured Ruminococcus sp.]
MSYIPNEMKKYPNWVCWKAVPDPQSHSGFKKIPVDPVTGKFAKSNDPQTWSDYDTALKAASKYSGVGFMFERSPFFGVDIDDCPEALKDYLRGGTNNIVYEFVNQLKSYAEISQSGNGIHIICKGNLPPYGRRKSRVEMYETGRFFVMTGYKCSFYSEIAEGSESIIFLHRKYILGIV